MTAKDDTSALRSLYKKHKPVGRTLLLGSKLYENSHSRQHWYPDCVGLDMQAGEGVDIVHDMEQPLAESVGTFNHVDCCSVLEHVSRPWLFAENVMNVMRPGASILVSVPFAWRVHGYPSDYWRMTPEAIRVLFHKIDWVDMSYTAYGKTYGKAPALNMNDRVYFDRSEVVAFGYL